MTPTVYPAILPVPAEALRLPPPQRVRFLSRHAREALRESAARIGVPVGALQKDARGAPQPFGGYFWSVTHKTRYVGGVLAPAEVGLDLEEVRPCAPALFRKTAAAEEWELVPGGKTPETFFRFWTAKEAVLKTGGEGIKGLPACRIARIEGDARLLVDYGGRTWVVDQLFFDGYVASVAHGGFRVDWLLP